MPIRVNNFLSWVTPRFVHINDAGTWRSIRNVFVNDAGTWRLTYARGLIATMTAGTDGGFNTGYNNQTGSYGSMSAVTLNDGHTVSSISYNSFSGAMFLSIAGFSSDPGQGYLTSLSIGGIGTLTPGDGNFFGYSYGTAAQWSWLTSALTNGGVYPIELYIS